MKMKGRGNGEMPTGVLVISFRVRRKETEAYVNNGAILRKGLYIIELRIRNVITQAEPEKNNQTNLAQCLIVGIPAQIAIIEYKSLSAAALPPVHEKREEATRRGKDNTGGARLTQHKFLQT